jgi:hypothetical protein
MRRSDICQPCVIRVHPWPKKPLRSHQPRYERGQRIDFRGDIETVLGDSACLGF